MAQAGGDGPAGGGVGDPAHFTALTRFGRDILPLGAERAPAFEEILAAQLADIEATIAR